MTESQKIALGAIKEQEETFLRLSDEIWELAELSLVEFESAKRYETLLRELGFSVETGIAGIGTAFLGRYGEGRPVIGILAEFDALSGLSQKPGETTPSPLVPGGNGHGCGHNLLGAGALAAAYGVKEYLRQSGKPGTVVLYGTPGEEGGAAKAFMAREGIWYSLDAALAWHPSDVNEVVPGSCNSCIQALYQFHGVPAHAAGDPEDGRSALDAVELMNVGVQYLREHMKPDARVHYAMVNGGGLSPNVVQAEASVLYMIRSEYVRDAVALTGRVDRIAEGAALMTGTSFEKIFIDGCSNTVQNKPLMRLAYRSLSEIGAGEYTAAEWKFAEDLQRTYGTPSELPTAAARYDRAAKAEVEQKTDGGRRAINDFLAPYYDGAAFEPGSTDVGDVSWQTPTVQIHTVCFPSGAPGHSWQNVSCGKTSLAYKGLLRAAKALALTAVELYESPAILAEAKAEWEQAAMGGYFCPIPEGEEPKVVSADL